MIRLMEWVSCSSNTKGESSKQVKWSCLADHEITVDVGKLYYAMRISLSRYRISSFSVVWCIFVRWHCSMFCCALCECRTRLTIVILHVDINLCLYKEINKISNVFCEWTSVSRVLGAQQKKRRRHKI